MGHSDADVLLHAVTDALLGAIAAGDIGDLFPDTAPVNRGRDSAEMLRLAYQQVRGAGYYVQHLDCIVFAQRPKLGTYKGLIRQRIAHLLTVPDHCVGLKAKTGEEVGPVGREEAISAQCVVLLGPEAPQPAGGQTTPAGAPEGPGARRIDEPRIRLFRGRWARSSILAVVSRGRTSWANSRRLAGRQRELHGRGAVRKVAEPPREWYEQHTGGVVNSPGVGRALARYPNWPCCTHPPDRLMIDPWRLWMVEVGVFPS